jgi:PAS domain S-box-containing protein
MPSLLRRFRPVDIVAALYAAIFFAWLAVRTPGTPSTQLVGRIAFYPLGLVVCWASWKTARLAGQDWRTRLGWMLLAASAVSLWLSGTAWDIFLLVTGINEYPAWVDYLEAAQNALAVAGFLVFPVRRLEGRDRLRFCLDAGLVTVAGTLVAVYFGVRLWMAGLTGSSLRDLVTGPLFDWLILVVASVGALHKRDRETRTSLALQVAAGSFYVVANYYYTVSEIGQKHPYHPGDNVDGFWFAAWAVRWVSARWSWYRGSGCWPAPKSRARSAALRDDYAGFAHIVVAGCFILLTAQVFADDQASTRVLASSALVLTVLMLGRQFVELRENKHLLRAQVIQEARFRSLVDHSSDAVLIVDGGGRVTYASPTASRVFGIRSPVSVGARLIEAVREDDRASIVPVLERRGGPPRVLMHVRAGTADFRAIEAAWTDMDADPAVGGLVLNCRDVTERSDLERQLRHAQKLDAVGQLAGGLAHDVNNALAIVGGYTELLRGEMEAGSPGADDLSHIQHAVDRAASITRKVLAFSRKQAAQPTVLNLTAVVREMLPMLRQLVTNDVDVRATLEPRVWPTRADRGQVEQVLVNLAANARDAMPDGGVLEISVANTALDAASPASAGAVGGQYVSIVVRDHGVGMAPDVRARIFEPFFTTKGSTGGMGLGLAMVHGIVKASGGRIAVESAPGEGAAFTVLLPRVDSPAAEDRPASEAASLDAQGVVLVVDDEDNVRVVARRMLERQGYTVIEAAGGAQALDVIGNAAVHLDVLLTDLVMPGLHGRDLIARCEVIRPALPIVCMTGFAGEGDDPGEYGRNLVALLSKPFSSATLTRAVAAAVSGRSPA